MVPQEVGSLNGESFSIRHDRLAVRVLAPGRLARLAARVRSASLDRALIAGADPTRSPQLAARVAILTSPGTRTSIADGLERLLQAAEGPPSRRRVRPRRGPVLASAGDMRELAALLRGSSPLYVRGIAIVDQLLTDGTGAAYFGPGEDLERRVREARTAMAG